MQVPNICAHLGEGVSKSQWNGGGEEEVGKSQDKHQDIPAVCHKFFEFFIVLGSFDCYRGVLISAWQVTASITRELPTTEKLISSIVQK